MLNSFTRCCLMAIVSGLVMFSAPLLSLAEEAGGRKEIHSGYLHPEDRYHYDLHHVRKGELVRISLSNVTGNLDPFLRVSSGDFSIEDDDSGNGSDAFIEFTAPKSETYNVELLPYGGETFGEYTLEVERPAANLPPSSSLASLNVEKSHASLSVQELFASLKRPGNIHKHELARLNEGQTLYIYVEALTDGFELEVMIRDFQHKVLKRALPNGNEESSRIVFPIAETGSDYDLIVQAVDGSSVGDYRIVLGINAPHVLNQNRKGMPRMKLADSETASLVEYLRVLPGKGLQKAAEKAGSAVAGKALFSQRCATCHGDDGRGFITIAESKFLVSASDAALRKVISGEHTVGNPIIREPKKIRVGFELLQVTSVNQQNENFGVVGIFRAEWHDTSLAFDPSDHEATKLTYADRQFVAFLERQSIDWPDFRIVNEQRKDIQHRVLTLESDGSVFYEERFAATLQAPEFDFREFPFDHQDFWIRIETLKSDDQLILEVHENPEYSKVGNQLGEEEWIIYESIPTVTKNNGNYHFSMDLKAKRHTTYYIYRILMPMSLIVLIGWAIFFILDHNTQIAAASGNLLVFIAFNFTVGGDLPRLGYLTFLDSLMLIGFIGSVASLMLAIYFKHLQEQKHAAEAIAIERQVLVILPLIFMLLIFISMGYFFIVH